MPTEHSAPDGPRQAERSEHVFFDLDGTLTDPAPGITRCLAHALEQLGRPAPDLRSLERFIGPPLQQSFGSLLATDDPALIDAGIGHYRDRFGEVGLFENEVYEGIPALLGELQASGRRLRVVTSKPTVYAARITAHFGLERYFEAIHGSELSGLRADKRELIAHVLETRSLSGPECVMIGDRSHDIVGGKAHGLRGIGVAWGYGSRDELLEAGADAVANDLDHLHQLLTHPAEGAS